MADCKAYNQSILKVKSLAPWCFFAVSPSYWECLQFPLSKFTNEWMNYLSKNEKSFVHYVNICIQLETQTATTYAIFYKQAGLVLRSLIEIIWSN